MTFWECIDYNSQSITAITAIAALLFAVYSLKRAIRDNKVALLYTEMEKCLAEVLCIYGELITLAYNIGQHSVHRAVSKKGAQEKAYDRFWRELGPIKERAIRLKAHKELLLPKALLDIDKNIIKTFNKIRNMVINEDNINEDEIIALADKLIDGYNTLLNKSRAYLGTSTIKPLTKEEVMFETNGANVK